MMEIVSPGPTRCLHVTVTPRIERAPVQINLASGLGAASLFFSRKLNAMYLCVLVEVVVCSFVRASLCACSLRNDNEHRLDAIINYMNF